MPVASVTFCHILSRSGECQANVTLHGTHMVSTPAWHGNSILGVFLCCNHSIFF